MVQRPGVLVGIDGSDRSGYIVDWAAAQAVARGGVLTVCHVLPPLPRPDRPFVAVPLREPIEHGRTVVEQAAWRARQLDRHLHVETRLERGLVAAQLLRLAEVADDVVVGARGVGGFGLLQLGSVGAQLAIHAVCPVTVVRGDPDRSREVLVGVDGSAGGEAALEYAFWFADHHRSRVHAMHAYPAAVPAMPFPAGIEAGSVRTTAQELVAETVAPWSRKYPHVPLRRTVVAGHAAGSLVAASAGSSLLVVGTRGRGGFAGLLLGSVSHTVLRHAHCPVTVAR